MGLKYRDALRIIRTNHTERLPVVTNVVNPVSEIRRPIEADYEIGFGACLRHQRGSGRSLDGGVEHRALATRFAERFFFEICNTRVELHMLDAAQLGFDCIHLRVEREDMVFSGEL